MKINSESKSKIFLLIIIFTGVLTLFSNTPLYKMLELTWLSSLILGLIYIAYTPSAALKVKEKILNRKFKGEYRCKSLPYISALEFIILNSVVLTMTAFLKTTMLKILLSTVIYLFCSVLLNFLFVLGNKLSFIKRFFYSLLISLFLPLISTVLFLGMLLIIPAK